VGMVASSVNGPVARVYAVLYLRAIDEYFL
jgi:hypothetical protein